MEAGKRDPSTDSDCMFVQLVGGQDLLQKQLDLAELTGELTLKEREVVLSTATLNGARQWAVDHWQDPSAWDILSSWADELTCMQEDRNRAVIHKVRQPGEWLVDLTPLWVIAKLKYMNWCINWKSGKGQPQKPKCFCLQNTAFMPNGCVHYPTQTSTSSQAGYLPLASQKFPSKFCSICSQCMRCCKYLVGICGFNLVLPFWC